MSRAAGMLPAAREFVRSLLEDLVEGPLQLAEQLGVSVNTVKFHLRNLYEKLDVKNRAQAVAMFLSE